MADPTPPIDPAGAHANFNPTPQTPVDRVAKNQSQSSQSPGDSPDLEALKKMLSEIGKSVPALKDLVDQVEKLSKKTDDITKSTGSFANKLKGMTSDYKYMVAGVDDVLGDVSDKFKQLAGYQRELGQHAVKNAKSYEEVLEVLEKMNEASEETLKRGLGSPEQLAAVRRHKETVAKAAQEMKGHLGKAFDPDVVMELVSPVSKVTNQVNKLSDAMKKARLTNLQHDIRSTTRGLQTVLGFKDRASKYHAIADVFHEIKEAKKTRRDGQLEKFQEHKKKILEALPTSGLGLEHYRRSDGSLDRKRYLADAKLAAKEHGYTGLAGRAMAQSALDEQTGVKSSMLTRVLAQGEGHLGKGVTSVALDALEGAGGAIGGVVAGGGLAFGIGELVAELIDKNQKQKAEIDEQISGSGGYDGMEVGKALHNVRANLNSYNPQLGIGYDKNFAILKSLNDAGLSTKNLNTPVKESSGFLNGSFGAMQQNVYAFGKNAGLNSDQTMTETIKLITQYKQSLVTTEDFFMQITKDSRAAGISTMKYIGLLDEVNSHYDRSNKLIMVTVDTIRTLGVTGRNTVEDISDQMKALTNNGKERSPGQRAYASQLIINDATVNNAENARRQQDVEDSIDNLYKAFGHIDPVTKQFVEGEEVEDKGVFGNKGDKITRKKVEELANDPVAMTDAIVRHFGTDGPNKNAATQAMNQLVKAQDKNLQLKTGDQDAVLTRTFVSPDQLRQMATSYALTRDAMRQTGFAGEGSDLFDKTKRGQMASNAAFINISKEAFGTDDPAEGLYKMMEVMTSTAESWVKLGQEGLGDSKEGSPERDSLMKSLEYLVKRLGPSGILSGKGSYLDQAKELNDPRKALAAKEWFTHNDGKQLMQDAYLRNVNLDKGSRIQGWDAAAQKGEDEAKEKVINTTTLKDLFEAFWKGWMNKVFGALDSINSVVSWWGKKQGFGDDLKTTQQLDLQQKTQDTQQNIEDLKAKIAALSGKGKDITKEDSVKLKNLQWNLANEEKYQDQISKIGSDPMFGTSLAKPDQLKDLELKHEQITGYRLDSSGELRAQGIDPVAYRLDPIKALPMENSTGKSYYSTVANTFNSVLLSYVDSGAAQDLKGRKAEMPSQTKSDVVPHSVVK